MTLLWMENASKAAENVYARFLDQIIDKHVLKDRENKILGEATWKKVKSGTFADPRYVRLMTISGKGGYSPDPELRKKYARFQNVTLLDHLLSVTRGAIVLSALDWLSQHPEMDTHILEQRLAVVAVIGFMHDLDKDLKLPRNQPLEIEFVVERMERYGIGQFLKAANVNLTPDQIRYLIEKVEATQAHRHAPDVLPPRDYESFPSYVRLADQLDGIWLSADTVAGGLSGVLTCLKDDQSCLHSNFLKQWREIQLFDPHLPFLLDELQRYLSRFSLHLAGILPLIEVHQDGHLFMLLPEDPFDKIVTQGINTLCNCLPFKLELNVSNRGVPALYNGQPDHRQLQEFIPKLTSRELGNLFKIKRELSETLEEFLDAMLSSIGLSPRFPAKASGALVTIYSGFKGMDESTKHWLYRATHLALLLNLKVESKKKSEIPDYTARETELLNKIQTQRPDWIESIKDDASRRTVTALWATALSAENEAIDEVIWNENDGLLKKWLEGDDTCKGFNPFFEGDGVNILKSLKKRLMQIVSKERIISDDEIAMGRCLFTDEPVPFNKTINEALGLYGVNVSAFSGRDGRPESITSERSHTNVGPCSIAEYKCRTNVHTKQGGKDNGVPTLVSSPTTLGLFGGLALKDDREMGAMSLYDLNRLEIKKGRVLNGIEMHQGRYRMSRLERMPESLEAQVDILRMMLSASLRIGRPFHVFRGLPTLQQTFFYFDAMPEVLVSLIGGQSLCLEQIPTAIDELQMARLFLQTGGPGYDALKMYAFPRSRFGAICLAWCHFRENGKASMDVIRTLFDQYTKYLEGENTMNEQDGALVKFGVAAAGIQRNPGSMSSTNEELLVFSICLNTAAQAHRAGQTDLTSLIYAVAGELETNLVRKTQAAAKNYRSGKSLMDGCMDVAGIFINDVWLGVMKGRLPSQKNKRVLASIYRIAFLTAQKNKSKEEIHKQNQGEI